MKENIKMQLAEAVTSIETVRDNLFAASRSFMDGDSVDWQAVESLFEISKKAEILRREIKEFADNERPETFLISPVTRSIEVAAIENANRLRRDDYPKYSTRDDAVVRTGLRRDRRTEYEHIVRKEEFEMIIERLNHFVNSSGFSVDEVQKELDLPIYQTYLVVSLLREHLQVIESKKKGTYRFLEGQRTPLVADEVIAKI